jgi:hypothetical protein
LGEIGVGVLRNPVNSGCRYMLYWIGGNSERAWKLEADSTRMGILAV